ncbi:MAG: SWIM zinc finger family protein [Xenococcaceae cyanobacterium]
MTNYQIENRQWWVQRWLELLDSYRFKKRLERARTYAREGNVLSIEFQQAQAIALVQGSESEPYQVSLSLAPFSDEDWEYIISTMSQQAIYSAQLLAGEMPENIEQVFISNGLSLFPFTLSEVRSRCSCPDKANPCKHIGAIYYQLADRFSEDPFVIFQLRGRTKTQILERLRQLRNQNLDVSTSITNPVETTNEAVSSRSQKESKTQKNTKSRSKTVNKSSENQKDFDLKKFWHYDEPLDSSLVVISPPLDRKTVLEFLGTIPLASSDAEAVSEFLSQVYRQASQQAVIAALNRD